MVYTVVGNRKCGIGSFMVVLRRFTERGRLCDLIDARMALLLGAVAFHSGSSGGYWKIERIFSAAYFAL